MKTIISLIITDLYGNHVYTQTSSKNNKNDNKKTKIIKILEKFNEDSLEKEFVLEGQEISLLILKNNNLYFLGEILNSNDAKKRGFNELDIISKKFHKNEYNIKINYKLFGDTLDLF